MIDLSTLYRCDDSGPDLGRGDFFVVTDDIKTASAYAAENNHARRHIRGFRARLTKPLFLIGQRRPPVIFMDELQRMIGLSNVDIEAMCRNALDDGFAIQLASQDGEHWDVNTAFDAADTYAYGGELIWLPEIENFVLRNGYDAVVGDDVEYVVARVYDPTRLTPIEIQVPGPKHGPLF